MDLKEALEVVVNESTGGCAEYAKAYAKAALELGNANHFFITMRDTDPTVKVTPVPTGQMMQGKEMHVQLLYVLSNLSSWRGERARIVKEILKANCK